MKLEYANSHTVNHYQSVSLPLLFTEDSCTGKSRNLFIALLLFNAINTVNNTDIIDYNALTLVIPVIPSMLQLSQQICSSVHCATSLQQLSMGRTKMVVVRR